MSVENKDNPAHYAFQHGNYTLCNSYPADAANYAAILPGSAMVPPSPTYTSTPTFFTGPDGDGGSMAVPPSPPFFAAPSTPQFSPFFFGSAAMAAAMSGGGPTAPATPGHFYDGCVATAAMLPYGVGTAPAMPHGSQPIMQQAGNAVHLVAASPVGAAQAATVFQFPSPPATPFVAHQNLPFGGNHNLQ